MSMAIVFVSVWALISSSVLGFISIEVEPSLIEYGKSGVNISCTVNGTNLIGISSIQLKRSESNVVSVTKYTVAYQDKELGNKTEVTVNASISDVMASYLHLEIPGSVVRYPKDTGSYQCILSCVTASGGARSYISQSIELNITVFPDSTETFSSTNHKSSEESVQKAFPTISIQVTDKVIEYGNTDIDIRCIVNGTSLKSTEIIQLKKSTTNMVSITQYGILWQDKNLQTRSKINATIENVNLSYLHLKIFACNVERTDDAAYFCDVTAIKEDFSVFLRSSDEISLNITGFDDKETCGSQLFYINNEE